MFGDVHISNEPVKIETKGRIISNEEIIQLDGEPKSLKNDLTIKIKPQSLKILVPNE